MYSLGVLFFEMWHPISTGMERIQVRNYKKRCKLIANIALQILRDLRRPEIVFPASWNTSKMPRQTAIVSWLLSHDPVKRASPLDLLQSDLLPPAGIDEALEGALRRVGMSFSSECGLY